MIELIKAFSKTWFSLNAFDKGILESKPQNHKTIEIQADQLYQDLNHLKQQLISKGEASELFAQEKVA